MNITRMLQLALGVIDAVPADRRPAIAEERLLHLAGAHRFTRANSTRQDELLEAAAEVLASVEQLYREARLDQLLCGLPPVSPAADPLNLIKKMASQTALDIGLNNYKSLASVCLDSLANWAQAHPNFGPDAERDDPSAERLSWERSDRTQPSVPDPPPARRRVRTGWKTVD